MKKEKIKYIHREYQRYAWPGTHSLEKFSNSISQLPLQLGQISSDQSTVYID